LEPWWIAGVFPWLDSVAGLWQVALMEADEGDFFQFLNAWGANFIAVREICRRVGGRQQFTGEPGWARPILPRMEGRGALASNATEQFRIKPVWKGKAQDKSAGSSDIAKIPRESGVGTGSPGGESGRGPDEYYDQL
jgi:hypothetical protein